MGWRSVHGVALQGLAHGHVPTVCLGGGAQVSDAPAYEPLSALWMFTGPMFSAVESSATAEGAAKVEEAIRSVYGAASLAAVMAVLQASRPPGLQLQCSRPG